MYYTPSSFSHDFPMCSPFNIFLGWHISTNPNVTVAVWVALAMYGGIVLGTSTRGIFSWPWNRKTVEEAVSVQEKLDWFDGLYLYIYMYNYTHTIHAHITYSYTYYIYDKLTIPWPFYFPTRGPQNEYVQNTSTRQGISYSWDRILNHRNIMHFTIFYINMLWRSTSFR